MAAMRPLMAAEPMLRAPRPEMVSESTLTGLFDCTTGADSPAAGVAAPCVAAAASAAVAAPGRPGAAAPTRSDASGAAGASVDLVPGMTKRALAMGTLASTFVRFTLE